MQLQHSTWREIETYLTGSTVVVVPIGSTEQHGPTGLIGTDALCVEAIAREAGERAGFLVAPTFTVGMAQHHMEFPGTITLRPSTMIAAICDWAASLAHHGFDRLYFLNGHGGNVSALNAAIAEIYHAKTFASERPRIYCALRNWWDLPAVGDTCRALFPQGDGCHATASEISLTRHILPQAVKRAELSPVVAPRGPIFDAEDFRARFPDGRIGSDPSLASAEAGERLFVAAVKGLIADIEAFVER